jgi:hypothetical protein
MGGARFVVARTGCGAKGPKVQMRSRRDFGPSQVIESEGSPPFFNNKTTGETTWDHPQGAQRGPREVPVSLWPLPNGS